ncbi:MAG TPA: Ig-like domain-containing protein [Anaerolineaceae bacterium]|nr:Ig-like domain-containing protein [Anaerolineaceae bacterium]
MKLASPFDQIVLGFLGLIVLLIGLVLARGDQVGAQVAATYPADGGLVSARGQVGVAFKQSMRADTFADRFRIQPETAGQVIWEGNTLWFRPSKPFAPGTAYSVEISPGGLSKDGRVFKQDLRFRFQIRPVEVLYLSVGEENPNLWRKSTSGGDAIQLTFTSGGVYDYAASPDGGQIAYSALNTQKGTDLWLVGRDGKQNRQLASCGPDRCIQAAWTPDGRQLVYERKKAGPTQTANGAPGGIYSVDLASSSSAFLFPGADPSWSPDGQWLVASDPKGSRIGITNVDTGEQVQVQASLDQVPTWFPDGSKILYSNLQVSLGIPQERVYAIDFQSKQVSPILNDDVEQVEYTLPAISPDGQWMVTSLHLMAGGQTRQLWLMDIHGKQRKAITHDELVNYSHYSWDPWGKSILFQQFSMGSSDALPQVSVWDRETGQIHLLAEAAALPEWLP